MQAAIATTGLQLHPKKLFPFSAIRYLYPGAITVLDHYPLDHASTLTNHPANTRKDSQQC